MNLEIVPSLLCSPTGGEFAPAQRAVPRGGRRTSFPTRHSVSPSVAVAKYHPNQALSLNGQPDDVSVRCTSVARFPNEAVIGTDLEGVITSWSPAAGRLFGFPAGEAIGKSVMLIVPLERAGEEAEMLRLVSGGECVRSLDTERRRCDGTIVHVSLHLLPLYHPDGRVIGAIAGIRAS